jgi:hypothetical protein
MPRRALVNESAFDEFADNRFDLFECVPQTLICLYDVISLCPLFGIGQLARENSVEFLAGHSRPFEDALPLNVRGRAYDDHRVHACVASRFVEKGDIEYDNIVASGSGLLKKRRLFLCDQRVNDPFESVERFLVICNAFCKLRAVDTAVDNTTWKRLFDPGNCGTARFVKLVHGGIGIIDR